MSASISIYYLIGQGVCSAVSEDEDVDHSQWMNSLYTHNLAETCVETECKNKNQRVRHTRCFSLQRAKQCVYSVSLGYRTFC